VEGIFGRVKPTLDMAELAGCGLVVEAATEKLVVKQEIFRRLDELLGAEAILASNTSSISITKLAGGTKRADRVIGMHFFNPVPVMALVEVIRGLQTSDATFEAVRLMALAGFDCCGGLVDTAVFVVLDSGKAVLEWHGF